MSDGELPKNNMKAVRADVIITMEDGSTLQGGGLVWGHEEISIDMNAYPWPMLSMKISLSEGVKFTAPEAK